MKRAQYATVVALVFTGIASGGSIDYTFGGGRVSTDEDFCDPPCDVYSFDLSVSIEPGDFDWRSSSIVAGIESGQFDSTSFLVGPTLLPPVRNPDGSQLSDVQMFTNMVSSPNDFPNVAAPGARSVRLLSAPELGTPPTRTTTLNSRWADSTVDPGADFVLFRLTIVQTPGLPALTTTPTGTLVASISGSSLFSGSDDPVPFEFAVYRLPEPGTFALLSVALLLRRRR